MAPDFCSGGLATTTAVLDLLSRVLEELVQPKNVQVPGGPASCPCLHAMERGWEETVRVR